jgi:transcription antitermination factor NusG
MKAGMQMISASEEAMNGDGYNKSWFAVQVRTNREKFVFDQICAKGEEAFLPTYREPRKWSDRTKLAELPLFPGYLFCRIRGERRLPILTTPGVRDIVGFGKIPVSIPDSEIATIRRFIGSELNIQPWPFLRTGQTVRIEKGPLAGVEGILKEVKGNYRVVVSISLLQRSVAAELDGTWVRGLGSRQSDAILQPSLT